MNFTKDSEFFLNFLVDRFDSFIKKKQDSADTDDIFKKIFDDLNLSYNYIKYLKRNEKIIKKLTTTGAVKSSDLIQSSFVPLKIKEKIENEIGNIIQYVVEIHGHKIQLNFIIYDEDESGDFERYESYSIMVMTWLKMAFMYSRGSCSKELTIYIYAIDDKKYLPEKQMNILSPNNCNSAVTTSCMEKTEIIVYRREEWFKVLIHESFHSLGLDFAMYSTDIFKDKIEAIFPLKNLDITESYAEFWATIINCLFCSFNLLDRKSNFEKFMLYNSFFIQFEQIYSLLQMVKILNFMGIEYKSLYQKDPISVSIRKYLYKEKTNVFAYYILKCLLLFHCNDFLHWCSKNNVHIFRFNRTPDNLMSFIDFIKKIYNSESFLDSLKNMKSFLKNIKKNNDTNNININKFLRSTRMTVCELVKKN